MRNQRSTAAEAERPHGGVFDRMPPLSSETMTEEQRRAAAELAAGPRGGVSGPFIPLLRSPDLMASLQKVGEYLRYRSVLEARIVEFLILIVSRMWTQQFEWSVHYPLALKAGLALEVAAALAEGRRPSAMAEDEEIAYDFAEEIFRTRGVSETTYGRTVSFFSERGVIDILGLIGYFTTVSIIMNVAHTPPPGSSAGELVAFPL